jgi:hypothetical protein
MLTVFMLLTITSPLVSGALLGLAAAAKFSPAGLLPLLAAPRQRGRRGALVCTATFAGVLAVAIFSWLPPGGLSYFWRHTIGFQMSRLDVFSPWALHHSLHPVQVALEVAAAALAAVVAFVPRRRSVTSVCALGGAVTIAIQLPATHWYYYYILWFLPFVLVAMLVADRPDPASPATAGPSEPVRIADRRPEREPQLVGA